MTSYSYDNIVNTIKNCCIEISNIIRFDDCTATGQVIDQNSSGDKVKALDLVANNILKAALSECDNVRFVGSEEESELMDGKDPRNGKYLVCYDPLDGSSNIAANITVGTIFGIYEYPNENGKLINGRNLMCAGYCLYGASTQFILADSYGVRMYQLLGPTIIQSSSIEGECEITIGSKNPRFVLIRDNMSIPFSGNCYAVNESNKHIYIDKRINPAIEAFIKQRKTARWVGSLVADAHRTLLEGGFFAYPANTRYPEGRLRLLYEVYPIVYIIEKAGGWSCGGCGGCGGGSGDDITSLLEEPFPQNIHQKCPVAFGSRDDMVTFMSWGLIE